MNKVCSGSILPPQTIRRLGILDPCAEKGFYHGCSFGLSSCSYDLRIADNVHLWPGHSVNVDAIERFKMPLDVMARIYAKSTWAREHVEPAGTIIDPGFRGVLRLELNMHHGSKPITISAGTAVVQCVFERLEEATEIPYAGKYQDQKSDQDAIFSDE